jgi:hypothetical protein
MLATCVNICSAPECTVSITNPLITDNLEPVEWSMGLKRLVSWIVRPWMMVWLVTEIVVRWLCLMWPLEIREVLAMMRGAEMVREGKGGEKGEGLGGEGGRRERERKI